MTALQQFLPKTLTDSLNPIDVPFAAVMHTNRVLGMARAQLDFPDLLTREMALATLELLVRGADNISGRLAARQAEAALLAATDTH